MQNYGGSQQIEETLCGAWHLYELMDENGFTGLAHGASVDIYLNPHFSRNVAEFEKQK